MDEEDKEASPKVLPTLQELQALLEGDHPSGLSMGSDDDDGCVCVCFSFVLFINRSAVLVFVIKDYFS